VTYPGVRFELRAIGELAEPIAHKRVLIRELAVMELLGELEACAAEFQVLE